MINYLIDNDWKWNQCSLPIKRSAPKGSKSDEEYLYQVMNCEETADPQDEKVKITMDKSFPFESNTGFVWHKSWNLPKITVNLSQEELEYLSSQYGTITCEMMAVYPVKQGNYYYLNEVPLQGDSSKGVIDPIFSFEFLKFAQTSFNHNRNKFCLLVWLFGESSFGDKDDIFCLISPPIYVDSRKEARKKQSQTPSAVNALHTPKKFVSPITGTRGIVANSSDGFLNYYSAQNIRNKIKHPFYICYHFEKVFQIYRNSQIEGIDLVLGLECIIDSNQRRSEKNQNIFLIIIMENDDKLRKRIRSMLEKWRFNRIQYGHPDDVISDKWVQIAKEQMINAYRFFYQNQANQDDQLNKKGSQGERGNSRENGNLISDKDRLERQRETALQNYEYRTVIELSKPRKQVKRQLQ